MTNPEIKFDVDDSHSNEIVATLEQYDNSRISVADFDPDGDSFLASHGYTHLGFYMGLESSRGNPVMEVLREAQTQEGIEQAVSQLGSFSILTAAQPATVIPKRFRDRSDVDELEARVLYGKQPYILSHVLSSGLQSVGIESFDRIDFTPPQLLGHGTILRREPMSKDFIPPEEWECLQAVHNNLAEQALKEILKSAELTTA